jgi:hypothetical protein
MNKKHPIPFLLSIIVVLTSFGQVKKEETKSDISIMKSKDLYTTLDSTWNVNKQKFRITLELNENASLKNTKVTLYRDKTELLTDSIFCSYLYVEFKDINTDGFKDVLVYQSSGARANETFNLFLYIPRENKFKKVDGFNDWPNLNTTELKGILVATILTGTVEYRFFRITDSAKLKDLGIFEEDLKLDGKSYKKGIGRVKKLGNIRNGYP